MVVPIAYQSIKLETQKKPPEEVSLYSSSESSSQQNLSMQIQNVEHLDQILQQENYLTTNENIDTEASVKVAKKKSFELEVNPFESMKKRGFDDKLKTKQSQENQQNEDNIQETLSIENYNPNQNFTLYKQNTTGISTRDYDYSEKNLQEQNQQNQQSHQDASLQNTLQIQESHNQSIVQEQEINQFILQESLNIENQQEQLRPSDYKREYQNDGNQIQEHQKFQFNTKIKGNKINLNLSQKQMNQ